MRSLAVALGAAWMAGCGYVGDPQPPALHIPLPVADVRALQRGANLRIAFTLPEQTTEGLPVTRFQKVEMWVGRVPAGDFHSDAWGATARSVPVDWSNGAVINAETPVAGFEGQDVFCAVRTTGPRGRVSGWSNFFALGVVAPLARPEQVKAEASPGGVRLSWNDPRAKAGLLYRVTRQAEGEEQATVLADARGSMHLDGTAAFGKKYRYAVQSILKIGEREAESELSEPIEITPEDVFAPATPAGVNALAGVNSIELAWDRNTESDFRGYFVYRAGESGEFHQIAGPVESPAYSDRKVESGSVYRYAVSAVDTKGNESGRSEPIRITVP